MGGGKARGQAQAAELGLQLPRGCPEVAAVAHGRLPKRVHHDQRADGGATLQHRGCRPDPALQRAGQRTGARAHRSHRAIHPRRAPSRGAKRGIGIGVPPLVAAVQQVEHDRARHDRHPRGAHGKAAPRPVQRRHHPVAGRKAEGRPACQHQRIDPAHQLVGRQQVGFPRPGRAAHHVDTGRKGRICGQHGDTGPQGVVLGMAHAQPGHVGDPVARAGDHARALSAASRVWVRVAPGVSASGSSRNSITDRRPDRRARSKAGAKSSSRSTSSPWPP